jgi:Fic family protein
MSELEKFMNEDSELDELVKAALIHYQFETIHPFLDGNGRIGRLLIILYLIDKKILSSPVLYISYYLKKTVLSIMTVCQRCEKMEIMSSGLNSC